MLKILAGEYRSRRLAAPPDGDVTRPYLARVRESVFSLLRGWFEDASVLDLFAGVGTVGLEAISRGARRVVMVEQNRMIFDLLTKNIETLGCGDRAVAVPGDALGSAGLMRAEPPVDLVFIDPPYAMMKDEATRGRVLAQAARCRSLMGDSGFLVLRSPIGPAAADVAIEGFDGPETHRYGHDQWVLLYAPASSDAGQGEPDVPTGNENSE
jgi:16S rRNA (guanine(966)-N(2))-methyltransferase RsmD